MLSTSPLVRPIIVHKTKNLPQTEERNTPRDAELILYQQGYPSQSFSLSKNRVLIGKAPDNDIVITDSYVSAHHCVIEKRNNLYFLMDNQSRNGTYLNNMFIRESSLINKAQLSIGQTLLQFRYKEEHDTTTYRFDDIISINPLMQHIFQNLKRIAESNETVVIYGETGSGKELFANAIHRHSHRKNKPFIAINCGAIPSELLESELFGHVKGAFTGAHQNKQGYFQAAEGGTVLLDEIGELPLSLQPKLLRVLEQKEIRPVGSDQVKKLNVRIVAATHRDLTQMTEDGTFRSDLYYRLHLIPIHIPALRDRKEDIPHLVKHFLKDTEITSLALKKLVQYSWPGNIRELKNILDQISVLIDTPIITEKDVQQILNSTPLPFAQTIQKMERDLIYEFLEKNHWNRSATARALNIPKTTLIDKIKRLKIKPPK